MSTAVMQELVQELESRSIALPSETGILNKCRDALVRASASVDDVASTIEAVMMNNNSNEITDAIVAQVVMSLNKAAAKRTVGKSVTHKAPTPVQRFTKSNVAQLPGFGSSSFEAAFNVKIGGGQSAPGGATPTMVTRPPVRRAPTTRRPVAATASPTTRVPGAAAKRKAPPAVASPPQASNKARRLTALGGTPGSSGKSPATAAKSPDQGDYATRQNAGKVEASLNAAMKGPADTSGPDSVVVEPLPSVLDHNVKKPYRFMLTPLAERAMALEQRILDMEAAISASGRFPDITPVGVASQAKIIVVGRVCPEGGGRLTRGAILLEGSRRTSNSARVAVDVRELKAYHLFPGQVVALEGMCTTGTRMVAQRVIEGIYPKVLRAKPSALRDARTLRMWTAAGPFTLASDIAYTPLTELFAEALAADTPPDVICLMGPFVDVEHPTIRSSRVDLTVGGQTLPVTFAELFSHAVERTLSDYLQQPNLARTHVVLVPSTNDAHVVPVYPQPPMPEPKFGSVEDTEVLADLRSRVHVMSNPSSFVVNGIVVSASTADFLAHASRAGVFRHPAPVPHLPSRLAESMIRQHSFYPMYPAQPSTPVELSKQDHAKMTATPDVLLLPSQLAYFARVVNNVVVVNPGVLTKGNSAGTYGKLTVFPMRSSHVEAGERILAAKMKAAAEAASSAGSGSGAAGEDADSGSASSGEDDKAADGAKYTDPTAGVLPYVGRRTKVEIVRI